MSLGSLEKSNQKNIIQPYTELAAHAVSGPNIIKGGDGVWAFDANGNKIFDGAAGLWCVNVGYGREEIAQAIYKQTQKLAFFHSFTSMSNEPAIKLAEKIFSLAPKSVSKVFFGNSGSDANDTQVKMVWNYNNILGRKKKKKIISRKRAYHGVTIGAGSLTGIPIIHKSFDLPLPRFLHAEAPYYYRGSFQGMSELDYSKHLAKELDDLINAEGPETVAAFIAEPLMGTGGVLPPPEGYFQEIQKILKKHDVLMIADEVITGFGRLGEMFASDLYNIKPDMMTLAKGLASGYQPISASLISDEIYEVLKQGSKQNGTFAHGFTYSAHPVAAAAGLANLEIVERENLPENARVVGQYFHEKLKSELKDEPYVGDVRGQGLVAGIELVQDREKKTPFESENKIHVKVAHHCYHEEKLIVRALPGGHVLSFSPALIVTKDQIDDLVGRFKKGLRAITNQAVT